jgi:hypothetical protein
MKYFFKIVFTMMNGIYAHSKSLSSTKDTCALARILLQNAALIFGHTDMRSLMSRDSVVSLSSGQVSKRTEVASL